MRKWAIGKSYWNVFEFGNCAKGNRHKKGKPINGDHLDNKLGFPSMPLALGVAQKKIPCPRAKRVLQGNYK